MTAGNVARIVAVVAACVAAAGSATSRSSSNQNQSQSPDVAGPAGQNGPPPPQQMEATRALGLWRSTFGAVKIEPDSSRGGLDAGNVQGIWVYQRQGQEVVGYFAGSLRGNVLQFRWEEPNEPPLTGEGFLVFDTQGRQYSGRWWSDKRDRVGDWSGWRQARAPGRRSQLDTSSPYGGESDGDEDDTLQQQQQQQAPQPRARRQQLYRPQPQPQPQPQPYQQQAPQQQAPQQQQQQPVYW